jgi:hypothetical protein
MTKEVFADSTPDQLPNLGRRPAFTEKFRGLVQDLNRIDPMARARFFLYEAATAGMFLFSEGTRYTEYGGIKFRDSPMRDSMTLPLEQVWTTFGPTASAPFLLFEGFKQVVKPILYPKDTLYELKRLFSIKDTGVQKPKVRWEYGTYKPGSIKSAQLDTFIGLVGGYFIFKEISKGDIPDTISAVVGSLLARTAGREFIKRIQPGRISEIQHNVDLILDEESKPEGKLYSVMESVLSTDDNKYLSRDIIVPYKEVFNRVAQEIGKGLSDIQGIVRSDHNSTNNLKRFQYALSRLYIRQWSQKMLADIGDVELADELKEYIDYQLERNERYSDEVLHRYRKEV